MAEALAESLKSFPYGVPSRPHQDIFTQGAYNWDGAEIHAAYTSKQILDENNETDENDNVFVAYDETLQPIVGRIDGQTGWTGIN